jgi:uncharacterized protein YacL
MSYHPPSLLGRLVGACISLLVAALAIYVAVHLLESVWPVLAVIGFVVVVIIGLVAAVRRRQQGW